MQNQSKLDKTTIDTSELIAFYSSTVIIATGIVYWIIQINGVMEMLELAYGQGG